MAHPYPRTVKLPVVANGEVWSPQDYQKIRQLSGCTDVMIAAAPSSDQTSFVASKQAMKPCLATTTYLDSRLLRTATVENGPRHAPGYSKWLGMMRTAYPEAETCTACYARTQPECHRENTGGVSDFNKSPW